MALSYYQKPKPAPILDQSTKDDGGWQHAEALANLVMPNGELLRLNESEEFLQTH